MTTEQIEQYAAKAQPIPKDLTPPEAMLYHMLLPLYEVYRRGVIGKDEGKARKQRIYNVYEQFRSQYKAYLDICAQCQKQIREGYKIGNVVVIRPENELQKAIENTNEC